MQTLKSGTQFVVARVSFDPYSRHRFSTFLRDAARDASEPESRFSAMRGIALADAEKELPITSNAFTAQSSAGWHWSLTHRSSVLQWWESIPVSAKEQFSSSVLMEEATRRLSRYTVRHRNLQSYCASSSFLCQLSIHLRTARQYLASFVRSFCAVRRRQRERLWSSLAQRAPQMRDIAG
jgi:hypothetical protein